MDHDDNTLSALEPVRQNAHDQLAVKMEALCEKSKKKDQKDRLREKELRKMERIDEYEKFWCNLFLHQMKKRLGIRREFLGQLDDKELEKIDCYLLKLSRWRRRCWIVSLPLLGCVPVLGWLYIYALFGDRSFTDTNGFDYFLPNYLRFRRIVKKYHGEEYFPHERLREMAKKNT